MQSIWQMRISPLAPKLQKLQEPKILLSMTAIMFLLCVLAWKIWKKSWNVSPVPSLEPEAVDFTNPDINAAPVDLTTMGAATDLPLDHPLRSLNGRSPGDLSPNHNGEWDSPRIASKFDEIELRLDKRDGIFK